MVLVNQGTNMLCEVYFLSPYFATVRWKRGRKLVAIISTSSVLALFLNRSD